MQFSLLSFLLCTAATQAAVVTSADAQPNCGIAIMHCAKPAEMESKQHTELCVLNDLCIPTRAGSIVLNPLGSESSPAFFEITNPAVFPD